MQRDQILLSDLGAQGQGRNWPSKGWSVWQQLGKCILAIKHFECLFTQISKCRKVLGLCDVFIYPPGTDNSHLLKGPGEKKQAKISSIHKRSCYTPVQTPVSLRLPFSFIFSITVPFSYCQAKISQIGKKGARALRKGSAGSPRTVKTQDFQKSLPFWYRTQNAVFQIPSPEMFLCYCRTAGIFGGPLVQRCQTREEHRSLGLALCYRRGRSTRYFPAAAVTNQVEGTRKG